MLWIIILERYLWALWLSVIVKMYSHAINELINDINTLINELIRVLMLFIISVYLLITLWGSSRIEFDESFPVRVWILSENACDFTAFWWYKFGESSLSEQDNLNLEHRHKGMLIRDLIIYTWSIYVLRVREFFLC